jgi:hypothetical protein
LSKAKKAFQKFPEIGEPGAEKILLFTRSYHCTGSGIERVACPAASWVW